MSEILVPSIDLQFQWDWDLYQVESVCQMWRIILNQFKELPDLPFRKPNRWRISGCLIHVLVLTRWTFLSSIHMWNIWKPILVRKAWVMSPHWPQRNPLYKVLLLKVLGVRLMGNLEIRMNRRVNGLECDPKLLNKLLVGNWYRYAWMLDITICDLYWSTCRTSKVVSNLDHRLTNIKKPTSKPWTNWRSLVSKA